MTDQLYGIIRWTGSSDVQLYSYPSLTLSLLYFSASPYSLPPPLPTIHLRLSLLPISASPYSPSPNHSILLLRFPLLSASPYSSPPPLFTLPLSPLYFFNSPKLSLSTSPYSASPSHPTPPLCFILLYPTAHSTLPLHITLFYSSASIPSTSSPRSVLLHQNILNKFLTEKHL